MRKPNIFETIKTRLLSWARRRGVHIWRYNLPKGTDLIADLKRFQLADGIKSLIDVGANVGDFSSSFLDHFPNLQKVVAIEPEPRNFEQLKRGLKSPKAECLQCAIANSEGKATLHLSSFNTMHSLSDVADGDNSIEVSLHTLSYVFSHLREQDGIFLKTDTEGHDLDVLLSGADFLASGKITFVLCEVAFHSDHNRLSAFSTIWDLLKANGFDLWAFYDQSRYRRWNTMDHCNALFLHAKAAKKFLPKNHEHPWK